MKMTKRLATLAACAVMAASSMVGMGANALCVPINSSVNNTENIIKQTTYSTPLDFEKFVTDLQQYYQSGQSWSNKHCGGISNNPTIEKEGCAITSFAMVENFYGGSDNPGQVSDTLGSNAYPMNWYAVATAYGLNSPTINYYGNNIVDKGKASSTICGYVRSNKPVIVGLKNSSGNTHFVVARGAAPQNANVYIYDPASNNDYIVLDQYYNDNYYVYEIIVY